MDLSYARGLFIRTKNLKGLEIIFVGSKETHRQIQSLKFSKEQTIQYLELETHSRGEKFQKGFLQATGALVLFHHPRSKLPRANYQTLLEISETFTGWGAFTLHFSKRKNLFLKLVAAYSNFVRLQFFQISYLDHCIFSSRTLLERIQIPRDSIFEDTILCRNLRALQKPKLLALPSFTSPVRFEKKGMLRQFFLNQFVKILFFLGVETQKIYSIYERSLWLNRK